MAQKMNSHNGLENKQPQWLRKFRVNKGALTCIMLNIENREWWVKDL